MVQTSHSLRTLHRVVAPYHGLPGKHTALRTVFAAARADAGESRSSSSIRSVRRRRPERVTELITPIARAEVEFLAPRYRRHPRDGVLVTQLVRPLVRALYGVALDEPLGAEFSCSGRFASHCLEQDIWDHEAARFAIDLWLRTEAVAERFAVGQIWRPATDGDGARTTLRDAVQQVVLSLVESLRAHDSFWKNGERGRGAAHMGHRTERGARRAGLGLPGPRRAGASRHRRDQAAARASARARIFSRGWSRRQRHRRGPLDDELWVRTRLCVRRGRTPRADQPRAPGRHVRSALSVACGGIHGARRDSKTDATVQADSTRSVRHSNG